MTRPGESMEAFQDAGEVVRRQLGVDGTAGDAQDVPHGYVEAEWVPCCVACGLSRKAAVHGAVLAM
jgi:hypothetical protein